MQAVSRRQFLFLLSSLSLCSNASAAQSAKGYKFHQYPFALGVASGSPCHNSVVIWTRLILHDALKADVSVHWEMAEDDGFRYVVQSGVVTAISELGHSVHVEVHGLQPDRWYWYRFRAGDADSQVGRTRTFPAPSIMPEKLRFAYASCQRWDSGYYAAYQHMAEENLDCVVFLGDYIYEGNSRKNSVRTHDLPVPFTLSDYRRRYELYKSDMDLQRMHAICPWIVTWDDHEVANNYTGTTSSTGDAGFLARRTAAYQAYYEHMPLRSSALLHGIGGLNRTDALRVYNRYRFGRLATFHMLDNRQYRDLPLCGKKGKQHCSLQDNPKRSYLGLKQEQWLDEGLRSGTVNGVRWDIIGSQTVFTRHMSLRKSAGNIISSDTWSGYRGAQTRLIDSIVTNKVRNAIIVGGDIHQNRVANVHKDLDDPDSPVIASEFCGTSISSASGRAQRQIDRVARKNPHWLFANSVRRGYGVAEVTQKQFEVTLRGLHDVKEKGTTVETLASFVVKDGKPGIRRLR